MEIALTVDNIYHPVIQEITKNTMHLQCNVKDYSYFVEKSDGKNIITVGQTHSWIQNQSSFSISVMKGTKIYRVERENLSAFLWAASEVECDVLQTHVVMKTPHLASRVGYVPSWAKGSRPEIEEGSTPYDVFTQIGLMPSNEDLVKTVIEHIEDLPLLHSILKSCSLEDRCGTPPRTLHIAIKDNFSNLSLKLDNIWKRSNEADCIFLTTEAKVACMDKATMAASSLFDADTCPWILTVNNAFATLTLEFNLKAYESKLGLINNILGKEINQLVITPEIALDVHTSLYHTSTRDNTLEELKAKYCPEVGTYALVSTDGTILFIGDIHNTTLEYVTSSNLSTIISAEIFANFTDEQKSILSITSQAFEGFSNFY